MKTFRILHLSDIHIGNTYINSEEIANKIIADIANNGLCEIKSVVVTGDIFEGTILKYIDLVTEAVNFFEIILNEINAFQTENLISKEDFIFIPGNHDIIRTEVIEERWKKYHLFLEKFYVDIPNWYDLENYTVIRPYNEYKIIFMGFNSCQLEKKKIFDNKMIEKIKRNISDSTLNKSGIKREDLVNLFESEISNEYDDYGEIATAQINKMIREYKKYNDYNPIALFHHHFYLFPEIVQKFGDSSIVRNHTNLTRNLKYMNVETILHGHKHFDLERPFVDEDFYDSVGNIINVFSGGSVGTARSSRHTFSIIDVFPRDSDIKIKHNKFVYKEENLEPINRKQIPPSTENVQNIILLDMLKNTNYEQYSFYYEMIEKMNKTFHITQEVTNWIGKGISGFTDVKKLLDNDYKNTLFLLYAVNYRILSYKSKLETDSEYYTSNLKLVEKYYDIHIKNSNFNFTINDLNEVLKAKKMTDLTRKCDKLLKNITCRDEQRYIAFAMAGVFFSDLYLVLTEYADDFYNETLKFKVNIKIENNKFHKNVPAPRIVIESDSDRRSAFVNLYCNEATAHKMAVLFIKEFDLMINKFEDYFKLINLKLYYLVPKIDKYNGRDTVDNYNFEAYIPTLLPLLTGDNIYPSYEVFARELLQNSIDAISVRAEKEGANFDKSIYIDFGEDNDDRLYFKIRDFGTGMDRYKIERYFTSIGRSFYSGDEYEDLEIKYKPISSFGIGFLSSFMVCEEIDVKTRFYLPHSEGLKLHIPNYDGCFFIENDDTVQVGTEIKLYLRPEINIDNIINYINKVMQDVKYDIIINHFQHNEIIKSKKIRKSIENYPYKFFVPLTEDGKVEDISFESVKNNEYLDYEYGVYILPKTIENFSGNVLNAGILVEGGDTYRIFNNSYLRRLYRNRRIVESIFNMRFIFNFPSNWIQLDVSREKVTGFTEYISKLHINNPINDIGVRIAESVSKQIEQLFEFSKENDVLESSLELQYIIINTIGLCGDETLSCAYEALKGMQFVLCVEITRNKLNFVMKPRNFCKAHLSTKINANEDKMYYIVNEETINYFNDIGIKLLSSLYDYNEISDSKLKIANKKLNTFLNDLTRYFEQDDYQPMSMKNYKDIIYDFDTIFEKFDFKKMKKSDNALCLISIYLVLLTSESKHFIKYNRRHYNDISLVEKFLLSQLKISDIIRGQEQISLKISSLNKFVEELISIS